LFLKKSNYNAIISSDWNECLAPSGPFDVIAFNYPDLKPQLTTIFAQYTTNTITLGSAMQQIQALLPSPVTSEQVDAYLANHFTCYNGVPQLIEWCKNNDILFMINTTAMIGFFQRLFAKELLPKVPVLSAHPLAGFPERNSDPVKIFDLFETDDKGKNTDAMARSLDIPPQKIVIMGDSGGDGPHFEWGAANGAYLVGSMTKPSLKQYCREKGIQIDLQFGVSYSEGEPRNLENEMQYNFMDLSTHFAKFLEI